MTAQPRRLRYQDDPRALIHESLVLDILNRVITPPRVRSKAVANISKLLELMQNLEDFRSYLPNQDDIDQYKNSKDIGVKFELRKAIESKRNVLGEDVNRILSKYKWSPGISVHHDLSLQEFPQFSKQDEIETVAAWLLLGKLQTGEIRRFRCCGDCKRWFYAKTDHQRFCKDRCRKKYASQSKEYKTRRRLYMRRYRRDQKEKDAVAKTLLRKRN